jgi:electron transport complex protein RnfB
MKPHPQVVAHIDPTRCIGCTFCLKACPVDAIFGAAKKMHTVIEAGCTGCEQCITSCPMDCIDLKPAPLVPISAEQEMLRTERKQQRLNQTNPSQQRTLATTEAQDTSSSEQLAYALQAAIARGKAKRQKNKDGL